MIAPLGPLVRALRGTVPVQPGRDFTFAPVRLLSPALIARHREALAIVEAEIVIAVNLWAMARRRALGAFAAPSHLSPCRPDFVAERRAEIVPSFAEDLAA